MKIVDHTSSTLVLPYSTGNSYVLTSTVQERSVCDPSARLRGWCEIDGFHYFQLLLLAWKKKVESGSEDCASPLPFYTIPV
jgi:hypothetical protein